MSAGTRAGVSSLWRRNLPIWAALMALLTFSAVAAYWPLGVLTTVIGIAVALVKAGLVAVLFMQLRRSQSLTRLAAACGLFWLAILFVLTLSDTLSRLANV